MAVSPAGVSGAPGAGIHRTHGVRVVRRGAWGPVLHAEGPNHLREALKAPGAG